MEQQENGTEAVGDAKKENARSLLYQAYRASPRKGAFKRPRHRYTARGKRLRELARRISRTRLKDEPREQGG